MKQKRQFTFKMSNIRRICACILTIIVVLQSALSVYGAEVTPRNLQQLSISNSGFESTNTLADWFGWDSVFNDWEKNARDATVEKETGKVYRGSNSAKLSKTSAGEVGLTNKETISVTGGAMYSFGAYLALDNAPGCVGYVVLKAGDSYYHSEYIYGNVAEYTKVTGTVMLDSSVTEVTLSVYMKDVTTGTHGSNGTAILYADEVFLTRHTPNVSSGELNEDFETVATESSYSYPKGWTVSQKQSSSNATSVPPAIHAETKHYHSGEKSLYIGKDSLIENTYIDHSAKITVDPSYVYRWGLWYKSLDSDAFLRLDLLAYDKSGNLICTLTGNSQMLSHSEVLDGWNYLYTEEQMPENAASVSYRIVCSEGQICTYVDDLFCKPVENAYEKIVDFSDLSSTADDGTKDGWIFGTDKSHTVDAVKPGYTYEIQANYTASSAAEVSVQFYDAYGNLVGEPTTQTLASAAAETPFTLGFVMPDAVTAEIQVIGADTLEDYALFETSTPSGGNGWTANWLWYPSEDANSEAYWQYRFFRTYFELDETKTISSAKIRVASDDNIFVDKDGNGSVDTNCIFVNGTAITRTRDKNNSEFYEEENRRRTYLYDIKAALTSGENVIAVSVLNCSNAAGLIFEGEIHYTDGTSFHLASGAKNTTTYVSKLNVTGELRTGNAYLTFVPTANWYKKDYDMPQEDAWVKAQNLGIPPYGGLDELSSYYDDDNTYSVKLASTVSATVKAGEVVTLTATYSGEQCAELVPENVTTRLFNSRDVLVATIPCKTSFKTGTATFEVAIPDYLPAGTYSLKPLLHEIRLQGAADNLFATLTLEETLLPAATGSVEKKEDGVRLLVNGKAESPIIFLPPHHKEYYRYDSLTGFADSGVDLYCTYNAWLDGFDGTTIWTGENADGTPIIDYDAFDEQIYKILDLNKEAMLIVNIGMDAPSWWLQDASHKDEILKDSDGNSLNEVSFASETYRREAAEVVRLLTKHMHSASYKHRVFGVRFAGGRTYEWMQFGIESGSAVDYSAAALHGFRAYLESKYGTVAALNTAWGTNHSNFSQVAIPTVAQRSASDTWILDPASSRNVIDYNAYLSQMITDSVLTYAKAVKDVSSDWIVGAYYGYMWNFNSANGIGSAHTTSGQMLDSTYIDFLASPVNYGERLDGYSTGYMGLSDSIAAHGKLYILEQDNRTIYATMFGNAEEDNPVGHTRTLQESLQQITRDSVTDFVNGNGLWFYSMRSGWFDNSTIYECIGKLKAEYDKSLSKDTGTNSEIAVFVGEGTYNYLTNDSITGTASKSTSTLMTELYSETRMALSQIGATYDTYSIEDLCDGIVSDYKLNIVLSPFELTDTQRSAINNELKTDGKTVLWVYLPGIMNGSTMEVQNVNELTGITSTLNKGTTTLQATLTDGNVKFGSNRAANVPYVVIDDASATTLGTYQNGDVAVAKKETDTYVSVYSAIPSVSAELLTSLCEDAGVHRYSTNPDDIVQHNKSYVSLYSQTAGTKTLTLDGKYRVYDVLNQKYVSEDGVSEIQFEHAAGDTALFRLDTALVLEYADNLTDELTTVSLGNNKFDTNFSSAGWVDNGAAIPERDYLKSSQIVYKEDFSSISKWNHYSVTNAPDNSSNKVAKYNTSRTESYYNDSTLFNTLEAGKEYTLTFRYNAVNVTATKAVDVYVYNLVRAGATLIHTIPAGTKNTGWQEVSYTFTMTSKENITNQFVRLLDVFTAAETANEIYFDDVKITYRGLPYYEVVEDYSFDFTTGRDTFTGDFTGETDTDGNKVISYTTGTGRDYFQNNAAYAGMVDGQEYMLSYRYKVVSLASASSKITLQTAGVEAGGSRDVTVAVIDSSTAKGEWIDVEHTFTYAGSSYSYWRILQVSGGTAGDQIYFDDITLTHAKACTDTIEDFSNDFEANRTTFTGDLTWITDEEGNKAISYTTGTGRDYFQNNVAYANMVEGQEYTLSYRYKVVSLASSSSMITIRTRGIETGGNRDVKVATIDSTTAVGEWIQISHNFTYESTDSSPRLLEVYGGASGDQIYFDDIRITHETPTIIYTSGKYQDEDGVYTLLSRKGAEFYRNSLTMTPGKTYQISYEIKTGDCVVTPYIMDRTNGNKKTTLNEYKVVANTDWTTYTFNYTCDGTGKSTIEGGDIVYRLGFARGSTGDVYARNFELREVIWTAGYDNKKLNDPSIIPEDSTIFGKAFTVPQKETVTATIPNVEKGKKYLLTFKVRTEAAANLLSVYLGSAGFKGYALAVEEEYTAISVELTPQESGNVDLKFVNTQDATYYDVVLHRIYELGDITASDTLDSRDIVRYKKSLSEETKAEPGTHEYSDMDLDDVITLEDLKLFIKKLLKK